jgi:glycosyltransferase involved in cell wall biosynthesis
VYFHGRLAADEVFGLMRRAAAVVVPSRWHENQPMVILEAFACAAPVITTAMGGLGELVETGSTGLVVPPNDPAALADAISDLVDAPDVARAMGRHGRQVVEDRFGPAEHLQALEQAYEQARMHQRAAAS